MKVFSLTLLILFCASFSANAQFPGCPAVDAGNDTVTDCNNPCVDLVATPFDAGATSSYQVLSIPHNPPIAYNATGGTGVSVGTDDIWSSAITLPFDFCFYGQTYNSCVIGSNGCIQFGTANAGGFHPWAFTASCPDPLLVDAGNIFGPYHDIDPSVSGQVNYHILGTAPCRIFVVTFDAIAHFSCTTLNSTHMIVLYETTNAIDVYVQDKANCPTWNSGNTVIGIQDATGLQGLAAPGRNTGVWTVTTPEGWRFLPDGAPIYTVEWFENGVSLGTTDTINVCPTVQTTYTVEATYTSCNGSIIVETDDVTVNPTGGGLNIGTQNLTPSDCNTSNGSVEITVTGGTAPYQYSLNNQSNFQPSNVFTGLASGMYTVFVEDASGCITPYDFTIDQNAAPDITLNGFVDATCGLNNGSIDVSAVNGTQPYTFTLNGTNGQPTGVFNGIGANTYLVEVEDLNGCTDTVTVTLTTGPAPTISLLYTDTICSNANNGILEVNAAGGTAPYGFAINGGTPQPGGLFTGLTPGTYEVVVADAGLCSDTVNVVVDEIPAPVIFAPTDACLLTFNVTGTQTPNGGYWAAADTAISFFTDSLLLNPTILSSTYGLYTMTFTDSICDVTVSSTINFLPDPWVFLFDTTICAGTQFNLTAQAEPSTTSYDWSTGETGSASITVNAPGIYSVDATNACGTASASAIIGNKVCDIVAPNVISLSSVVGNNIWDVEADGLESFHCKIVNRWGNLIYEYVDPNGGWDGRNADGEFVSEGTYFYIIDATIEGGESLQKHGFIEVVR